MNMKKILVITIIAIFVVGMCMGAADATHTVTKGKYKVKLNNKEYKKLTKTETKYKTVKKTRKVTKYHININVTSADGSQTWATLYDLDEKDFKYYESGKYKQDFTESVKYNVEKVPYKVTEKYTVKVPYKVRVKAKITKKIPGKYAVSTESTPIVKTVKVKKTVGAWKYVGKSYAFGIQTIEMKKDMDKRMKKLKGNGWKLNKKNHKGYIGEDGFVYHYIKCNKKVYKKERRVVGYKYKKVKNQVFMTISTTKDVNKKVFVQIWSHAGPISGGIIKI